MQQGTLCAPEFPHENSFHGVNQAPSGAGRLKCERCVSTQRRTQASRIIASSPMVSPGAATALHSDTTDLKTHTGLQDHFFGLQNC